MAPGVLHLMRPTPLLIASVAAAVLALVLLVLAAGAWAFAMLLAVGAAVVVAIAAYVTARPMLERRLRREERLNH